MYIKLQLWRNMTRICVIASIYECDGFWNKAAIDQCLSATSSLHKANFRVKVVTSSKPGSQFIQILRRMEVETVEPSFSLGDTTAVTSVLAGCNGVLLITDTNYNSENPTKDEVQIGRAIGDACKNSGIEQIVFCSKMHVFARFGLRCDGCDGKAFIADYLNELELPLTLLVVPFLYEDFLEGIFRPQKGSKNNVYETVAPTGDIPIDLIGQKDFGDCVKNIFEKFYLWKGKTINLSGTKLSIAEYAHILTDILYPLQVRVRHVTPDEYISHIQSKDSEDLANYFDFLTHEVHRNNICTTEKMCPGLESFFCWAHKNDENIKNHFDI